MNYYLYYYLRGLPSLGSSFFFVQKCSYTLYLSRNKTKRQFGKNSTLNPTKILPKKYGHSSVDFQIPLSFYKLDSQNKNYISNKNTFYLFIFFCYKIGPPVVIIIIIIITCQCAIQLYYYICQIVFCNLKFYAFVFVGFCNMSI